MPYVESIAGLAMDSLRPVIGGIYQYTPLRGARTVPWESVTGAGYSPLYQAHYLVTRTHGKIWFSPWVNGFTEFVEYIEYRSEMA